jgi:hypothetical protein
MSDHVAGCTGKIRYKDGQTAVAKAKRLANRHRTYPPQRPYRCEACSGWHLTTDRTRLIVVSEIALKEMVQLQAQPTPDDIAKTERIRARAARKQSRKENNMNTTDILIIRHPEPIPLENKLPLTDDACVLFRGPLPDKRGEQIWKYPKSKN